MFRPACKYVVRVVALGSFFLLLPLNEAQAVPSYARQTGMDCNACHTVFPELTPFGRTFKLGGYTLSKSEKSYEFPPPISAGGQASFTHTQKTLPPGAAPFESRGNDNVNVPQTLNIYYAGKIYGNLGTFTQGTYDGVSNKFALDHTDVRYARTTTLGDKGLNLIYGLTLNNNPTVQDVWNSTPAISFPYVSSAIAPTPAAVTKIDNALALQVGGIGAYAFWNNLVYAEVALYRTARKGPFQFLGAGNVTEEMVDGFAPYWRLALQHNWKQHSFSLGTYGMAVRTFPDKPAVDDQGNPIPNLKESRGPSNQFTDVALDAQYQFIGKKHLFSAQTTWIHEIQNRDASFDLGSAQNRRNFLDTFRVNLNYWYRSGVKGLGTVGGSVGYFSTTGTKDVLLYPEEEPVSGSRTGRPDSNGFILEANYLPWNYTKVSIQYIIYNQFNGARTNYDGLGRNASDNNTLYLNVWLIF
jgi:hypothetical protein